MGGALSPRFVRLTEKLVALCEPVAVIGDAIFFLTAAICQIVLGLIFMIRPSAQRWKLPAGALFIINGGISLASAWSSASPDVGQSAAYITALFDPLTSYLILFMALVYPSPPKFLQGKVKLVAGMISLAAAIQFGSLFVEPDAARNVYNFSSGWGGVLYISLIQEVAWTVLLVRWSRAVVRGANWQFGLLAIGLGVRASHMALVAVGTRLNKLDATRLFDLGAPHITWYLVISFIPVIALIYALFVCLAPQENINKMTQIFTGFLLLGLVEALFSMASLIDQEWARAPFLYLDVLVLRPILFWGALYGMPKTTASKVIGAVLFYAICLTAFIPAGLASLAEMQLTGAPAWFFSVLFALMMIGLASRFIFRLLHENAWDNKYDYPSNLKPTGY